MVEFTGFGPIAGVRVAHDLAPLPKAQPPNVVPAAAGADRVSADLPDQRGTANSGAQGGAARTGAQTGVHTQAQTAARSGAQTGTQTATADAGGAATARASVPLREDALTGPPPAFDTTPLDVATNLRLRLARLHAGGYGQDPATQAEAARSAPQGQPAQAVAAPSDKDRPAAAKKPEETRSEAPEQAPGAAEGSTEDGA